MRREQLRPDFHVLLLEDTAKTAQLVALSLRKKLQCRVTIAESHADVPSLVKADPPDLFLLDFYIDEAKGLEVCECFKKMDSMTQVPVVFFSDDGDALLRAAAIRSGAVEYIKKPFFPHELVTRIQSHINLKNSKERVVEQLKEQQALMRVLCHDLLNPVAAVESALSLVEATPENEEALEAAKEANQSALRLIEHVRNYRSLADTNQEFECSELDLRQVVEASIAIVRPMAERKGVSLLTEIENGSVIYINEVVFVHNILNNLLTNGIKFSHRKSVVRLVGQPEFLNGEESIRVSVEDEGIGIPSRILENIFQPHQNNSRAGTDNELGTGFGMPLVKHYVEGCGGSIEIESYPSGNQYAPWVGTRVRMHFPVRARDSGASYSGRRVDNARGILPEKNCSGAP